jgi:iron-sulfur cluster assembly protein
MLDVVENVVIHNINTGIVGAEEQDVFMIADNALTVINEIKAQNEIPEEYFLRLGTRSGGCSGMNYILGFDSEINDDDKQFKVNELNLVIDNKSLFYLQGVTLDYVEGPAGSGFVFNNPNNSHACGCGGGGGGH